MSDPVKLTCAACAAVNRLPHEKLGAGPKCGTCGAKAGKEAGVLNPVFQGLRVRRLMPVECERLQEFPDGHTAIPYRNNSVAADGPRYKAIGNSMAVPCMAWIGRRIEQVEAIT